MMALRHPPCYMTTNRCRAMRRCDSWRMTLWNPLPSAFQMRSPDRYHFACDLVIVVLIQSCDVVKLNGNLACGLEVAIRLVIAIVTVVSMVRGVLRFLGLFGSFFASLLEEHFAYLSRRYLNPDAIRREDSSTVPQILL